MILAGVADAIFDSAFDFPRNQANTFETRRNGGSGGVGVHQLIFVSSVFLLYSVSSKVLV
jgi:hypothetical protein